MPRFTGVEFGFENEHKAERLPRREAPQKNGDAATVSRPSSRTCHIRSNSCATDEPLSFRDKVIVYGSLALALVAYGAITWWAL